MRTFYVNYLSPRTILCIGTALTILLNSPTAHAKVPAGVASALSVIPGLGVAANGQYLKGATYFSLIVPGILWGPGLLNHMATMSYLYQFYDAWTGAGGRLADMPANDHSYFMNYLGTYNLLNALDCGLAPHF